MSGLPVPARKALFVSAPRAYAADGKAGQAATFAVTDAAVYVDLTRGLSQGGVDLQVAGSRDKRSPTRNYLAIVADVDLGIIFGPTAASVSGANAPVLATTGTLSSGVYSGTAGTCYLVPANTPHRFLLQEGVDSFLGIVAAAAAAGTCRIYQSSPDEA